MDARMKWMKQIAVLCTTIACLAWGSPARALTKSQCESEYESYQEKLKDGTCDEKLAKLEEVVKLCKEQGMIGAKMMAFAVAKCGGALGRADFDDPSCKALCLQTGGEWTGSRPCVAPEGSGKHVSPNGCALVTIGTQTHHDQPPPKPAARDCDSDGVPDFGPNGQPGDNCICFPNADQADTDKNGLGDGCQFLGELEWRKRLEQMEKWIADMRKALADRGLDTPEQFSAFILEVQEHLKKPHVTPEQLQEVVDAQNRMKEELSSRLDSHDAQLACLNDGKLPNFVEKEVERDGKKVKVKEQDGCKDDPWKKDMEDWRATTDGRMDDLEEGIVAASDKSAIELLGDGTYVLDHGGLVGAGADYIHRMAGGESKGSLYFRAGPRIGGAVGIPESDVYVGGNAGLDYMFGAPGSDFRVGIGGEFLYRHVTDDRLTVHRSIAGGGLRVPICPSLSDRSSPGDQVSLCITPYGGVAGVLSHDPSGWATKPFFGLTIGFRFDPNWLPGNGSDDDEESKPAPRSRTHRLKRSVSTGD